MELSEIKIGEEYAVDLIRCVKKMRVDSRSANGQALVCRPPAKTASPNNIETVGPERILRPWAEHTKLKRAVDPAFNRLQAALKRMPEFENARIWTAKNDGRIELALEPDLVDRLCGLIESGQHAEFDALSGFID
jgi:hypothetical protein